MKVAFLFSPYTCPRPLDFNNIWSDSRGLSGSDLGIIRVCQQFVKMGHDVSLFTVFNGNQPSSFDEIKLFKYEQKNILIDDNYDCIISWSCPDDLKDLPNNKLRVCCDMLNGFSYCAPGFDNYVDLWTACSVPHLAHQLSFNMTDANKWKILPLGCDPEVYTQEKIPGRMIWASSAERGLHLLLSIWPDIKKAVPEAHLKIFYNFAYGDITKYESGIHEDINAGYDIMEFSNRVRYMEYAIPKLKHLGVEHIGSVSRNVINKEMSKSVVMAFPCDPIAFTEGFSCSIMEACAAGSCPITTKVDALDHIYGQVIPTISTPVYKHLEEFKNTVIKALTDEEYRNSINKKAKQFASEHTWEHTAQKLETMIIEHPKFIEKPMKTSKINNELIKLNIAAGTNIFPYSGWINYDYGNFYEYFDAITNKIDLNTMPEHQRKVAQYLRAGGNLDFKTHSIIQGLPQHADNSVDIIVFLQAIEHFNPVYEIPKILAEIYRVLKPGGIVRISTPDMNLLINKFLNNQMDEFNNDQPDYYKDADQSAKLAYLMFGSGGPSSTSSGLYEGHHFLFTEKSMTKFLQNAGFSDITFYRKAGESKNEIIAKECVDSGMSHSFACDAVK